MSYILMDQLYCQGHPVDESFAFTHRHHRLHPLLNWIFPSSGFLCGVRRFKTDVSELFLGPIFKVKLSNVFVGSLTLQDGSDR